MTRFVAMGLDLLADSVALRREVIADVLWPGKIDEVVNHPALVKTQHADTA
jgi:hypothetical protein